jgi:hypothetical protein
MRARHVDEQRTLRGARPGKATVGEELLRQHTGAQRRVEPWIWAVFAGGLQDLGDDALAAGAQLREDFKKGRQRFGPCLVPMMAESRIFGGFCSAESADRAIALCGKIERLACLTCPSSPLHPSWAWVGRVDASRHRG